MCRNHSPGVTPRLARASNAHPETNRTMSASPLADRAPLSDADANANANDDGFMSHAPRAIKLRNVATHHPVRKLGPSTGVEAILGGDENAPFAQNAQRKWNENRARQHAGANLFGAASPAKRDARGERIKDANGKLADVGARYDVVSAKTLTLQELRQACRARGVNPGGSKDALCERLEDAIKAGAPALTLDSRPTTQRSAIGAGARFTSKACEVRAPSMAQRELRESQKIWRSQQNGHDIFGTAFGDAETKKRKVVEGPKTTFSFEAITQSYVDEGAVATKEVDVAPKRAKREAPASTNPITDAFVEAPKAEVETMAEHRKSAWSNFQGAGLFSEHWTTAEDEEAADEALVKSSTTETGAWKTLEEEQDEQDEDEAEAIAEREADEAVAAAERELAEELAREEQSD